MERLKIVSVENKTEVGRLHAICRGSFKRYYPGFDGWYRAKVLPGIGSSRWVLKAISGDRMAGICIVKDDGAEKKICSLRVDANHRGRGVGTALIAASIELLDDERPLITVPQEVMRPYLPCLRNLGLRRWRSIGTFTGRVQASFSITVPLRPVPALPKRLM